MNITDWIGVIAIMATGYIAWTEWQRAKRAESKQLREPAIAALKLIDRTIGQLRGVIDAKTDTEADAELVFAKRWAERGQVAAHRIAAIPVPDADLILVLQDVASGIENVATVLAKVPEANETARKQACENRIRELELYRQSLVGFASI